MGCATRTNIMKVKTYQTSLQSGVGRGLSYETQYSESLFTYFGGATTFGLISDIGCKLLAVLLFLPTDLIL